VQNTTKKCKTPKCFSWIKGQKGEDKIKVGPDNTQHNVHLLQGQNKKDQFNNINHQNK